MSKEGGGGLQVERWDYRMSGLRKSPDGEYTLFSDTKRFHDLAQEEVGKRMVAEARVRELEGAKKECASCKALIRRAVYDCPGHADGNYPCSGYEPVADKEE